MFNLKTFFVRIIGIGFLLMIVWNIVLFVLSIIFSFETEIIWYAAIAFGIIMAIIIWLFLKWMNPENIKQAFVYGISWTIIVYLITLIVTIPNGTTTIVFGNWISYMDILLMILLPPLIWLKTGRR